jgi:hypothetical protein
LGQKGGINGQEELHSGTDYQDDVVTMAASSTGIDPVISTLWLTCPHKGYHSLS